jgi:hypothetical protein
MKVQSAVCLTSLVVGLISAACSPGGNGAPGSGGTSSSGGTTGSGGTQGSGGTTGSGGITGSGGSSGPDCSDVAACGGQIVGTWSVKSSCLTVKGTLNLRAFGASCDSTPITGTLSVTGTFTAKSDTTYTDNTMTTGTVQFPLDKSCLSISSTAVNCEMAAGQLQSMGYSKLTCTTTASEGCMCNGEMKQPGTAGLISPDPSSSGNWEVSGNTATMDGINKYSICASATKMTWTPQSSSPMIAGTIEFQPDGTSTGSGGIIGTGGSVGSGGGTGTGGKGTAGTGTATGGTASGGKGGTGTAGAAGGVATGGANGTGGSGAAMGPCDIYKAGGTPCVAAHSTVRAMLGAYSGKLYQIRNAAGTTKDIMTLTPGGVADGASQDTFCSGTTCVVTVVYDQSGKGNDLWYQGSTMVPASTSSTPANAMKESLTVGGHKVYSLYIAPNNSYWVDASKSGIALNAEPEGMYMVTSGKHWNSGCCFDYGNSETDRKADGQGSMDTINLSGPGEWGSGAGTTGPWVKADLEYGVFTDNVSNSHQNPMNPSQTSTYVTAILKNNGTTEWALRGGDAAMGPLGTYFKGSLPGGGYSPMKKQGAIVLGSGGDCCKPGGGANLSDGTFYEGCIVKGYPTDQTENDVQANIVAAGYGK